MEGGSHAASCGTEIGQGEGVARVSEDFWNLGGRGKKNHTASRVDLALHSDRRSCLEVLGKFMVPRAT